MIYRIGDKYYVRGIQETDVDGPYASWFEDQEVCQYTSHGKFFKTLDHYRRYVRESNGADRLVWAVCHDTDGHIGNVTLQEISLINRSAELAIVLGDKRHWGTGIGKAAGRKIIEHGFRKLNLERIYCGTAASNVAMRRLAEALGMVKEGCRRRGLFLDGQWVDLLEYGLLREEFEATAGAR